MMCEGGIMNLTFSLVIFSLFIYFIDLRFSLGPRFWPIAQNFRRAPRPCDSKYAYMRT